MAAAALLLALKIKLRDGWTPTLQYYSGVVFDLSKLSWQYIYHKFLMSSSGHNMEVFHKKEMAVLKWKINISNSLHCKCTKHASFRVLVRRHLISCVTSLYSIFSDTSLTIQHVYSLFLAFFTYFERMSLQQTLRTRTSETCIEE
jgi:hypothetical protein